MTVIRSKRLSATLGCGALLAAVLLTIEHGGHAPVDVAGGSGDSATSTQYFPPTVPGMSLVATLSMGNTVTAGAPATTLGTALASPTLKASAAAGCVNNGQCP
jgi:hypothetical protein